jgi:hypothetical protein
LEFVENENRLGLAGGRQRTGLTISRPEKRQQQDHDRWGRKRHQATKHKIEQFHAAM